MLIPLVLGSIMVLFILQNSLPNKGLPCQVDLLEQEDYENEFCEKYLARHGYNLPTFYFTITTKAFPKEYYYLPVSVRDEFAKTFITSGKDANIALKYYFKKGKFPSESEIGKIKNLKDKYIPTIYFFKRDNKFKVWAANLLQLDFGYSITDQKKVSSKIWAAFKVTFTIHLIAFILILVSVFVSGYFAVLKLNKQWLKRIKNLCILILSTPNLVLTVLIQLFFATPFLSPYLNIFSVLGWKPINEYGFFVFLSALILPLFCIVLPEIAYLWFQFVEKIQKSLHEPFSVWVKEQGLSQKEGLLKYNLPFSVYPMIPLIRNYFISLVQGELIVELVFNIPGMGRLFYDSLLVWDKDMIVAFLMITLAMSLVGYLVSEIILYKYNPNVNFD